LGLHLTEKGKNVVDLILSQMNNRRLSTALVAAVDSSFVQSEIKKLLSGVEGIKGSLNRRH
jgi:hypothetical protein